MKKHTKPSPQPAPAGASGLQPPIVNHPRRYRGSHPQHPSGTTWSKAGNVARFLVPVPGQVGEDNIILSKSVNVIFLYDWYFSYIFNVTVR